MKHLNPFTILTPTLIICGVIAFFSATIRKELLYDKYTLADEYTVGKEPRSYQWEKIGEYLDTLANFQNRNFLFAVLTNYKNQKGISPIVEPNRVDKYKQITDTFGISRNQAIPLYFNSNLDTLVRYALDGSVAAILNKDSVATKVELLLPKGIWYIPNRYVQKIGPIRFLKTIFIDRKNENIATLEAVDTVWLARSLNPVTTGMERPPFKKATPLGIFITQNRTKEMKFYIDGSQEIGGYAPFATRFSGGGYLHGIPVNLPATAHIEFSPTLGTTPRSHMCVRNATSHAEFLYNWIDPYSTIVFVYE
ncbi:MAG: L,D-transpeptidase [Bacteroidales bacterium]